MIAAIRIALVLSVLAALAAAPGTASAGTVTGSSGSYTYTDVPGNQTNDLVITRNGDGDLVFADSAGTVDDSDDCQDTGATVTCEDGFRVFVELAGGNDDADASAAGLEDVEMFGGEGDDELIGGTDADENDLGGGDGDDELIGGADAEENDLEGGGEDDTLTGGAGDDDLGGGPGNDTMSAGAGDDDLFGDDDADTLDGGPGDDDLEGGAGADTLTGGANTEGTCGDRVEYRETTTDLTITLDGVANDTADGDTLGEGIESVDGGEGNDSVTGNDARNCFDGMQGNDVLVGAGGPDDLFGNAGVDTVDGGAGDDDLEGDFFDAIDPGDVYIGGDGVDEVQFPANNCPDLFTDSCPPRDVSVTLDGQPNDGAAGENDDVRGDVEDVLVYGTDFGQGTGGSTVTGTDALNAISTADGPDVVDAGTGSDLVATSAGDDTVNARDGFTDRVRCGRGTDTANVDQLDVVIECEAVNRETVPVALEDRPPTVDLVFPAAGARLGANRPTVLRANAADDRAIQRVLFLDDGRTVCNDDAAPFECAYQPRGEDIGRNTLMAVAVDSAQQAAFSTREVAVRRFRPTGLTAGVAPQRDRSAPYRFTVNGRLRLPAALRAALGCRGTVRITVRAGGRTIASRRVRLSRRCRYTVRIRITGARSVTVRARFAGNDLARARSSRAVNARSG